jgi:hypothetical protein
LVSFIAGAFIAGLPSPFCPWQPAHFDLKRAAPSSAHAMVEDVADTIKNRVAAATNDFQFMF